MCVLPQELAWSRVDGIASHRRRSLVRSAWNIWTQHVHTSRYDQSAVRLFLRSKLDRGRTVNFFHWRMLARQGQFVRAHRWLRLRLLVRRWRHASLATPFRHWHAATHTPEPVVVHTAPPRAAEAPPATRHEPWLLLLHSTVRSLRRRALQRAVTKWRLAAKQQVPASPPSPMVAAPAIMETGFGVFGRRTGPVSGVSCGRCVGGAIMFLVGVLLLCFLFLRIVSGLHPDAMWDFQARGSCCVYSARGPGPGPSG